MRDIRGVRGRGEGGVYRDGVVHVRSNETEEEMEETVKFIAEELLGAKLR